MKLLPNRIESIRSPTPAADDVLRACKTARDAFLVSVQLSRLTYQEIGARIGVSAQAVHKWRETGVPRKRVRSFCNATGTLLVEQFNRFQDLMREANERPRESDRIRRIAAMQEAA